MRKILLILLALAATGTALAQDKIQVVRGGEKTNYAVDAVSRIAFADEGVTVLLSDETGDLYLFAEDLSQILFHPTTETSVLSVTDRQMTLLVARSGDLLSIRGWGGAKADVTVFDLNGRRVLEVRGWAGADIDASALAGGVYVIKVGNMSAKFVK